MLVFREYSLFWQVLLQAHLFGFSRLQIASGLWSQEEILFLLWYTVRVLTFGLLFLQMNVQMKNIMNKFVIQEQYIQ